MSDSIIGTIEQTDVALSAKAGKLRHHPVVETAGFVSEISDQEPAHALAAAALAAGLLTGRPRLAEGGGRALLSLFLATRIKASIKAAVARTRPSKLLDEGHYEFSLNGPDRSDYNSFPSGHAADAAAAARAVWRVVPDAAAPLAVAAVGIGLVQVPRARHHLTDVVAGAVVGLVAEAAVDAAWNAGARRLDRAARRRGRAHR